MKNSSSDRIEYAKIYYISVIFFDVRKWVSDAFKENPKYLLISNRVFNMKHSYSNFLYQKKWKYQFSIYGINFPFEYLISKSFVATKKYQIFNLQKKPQKTTFFYFWYKEIPILHHCLYKKERYYIYCIPKILIYHKIRLILCRFIIAHIRQALPVYHKIILSDIRIIIFWINNSIFFYISINQR